MMVQPLSCAARQKLSATPSKFFVMNGGQTCSKNFNLAHERALYSASCPEQTQAVLSHTPRGVEIMARYVLPDMQDLLLQVENLAALYLAHDLVRK